MGSVPVDLIFYKVPTSGLRGVVRHGFWNGVAASVCRRERRAAGVKCEGGYSVHVEVGFPMATGVEEEAGSVWMGERVFFRRRSYANRVSGRHGHQHYTVAVPRVSVGRGVAFLEGQVGKEFNLRGMVGAVTPWASRSKGERWYCAELVAAVLGQMGVTLPFPTHKATPGKLEMWAEGVGAVSVNPVHARGGQL